MAAQTPGGRPQKHRMEGAHPWLSPLGTYWPVNGDEKVASKSRQYSTLGCSLKLIASISAGLGLGALPPEGAVSLPLPANIMHVQNVAGVSNGSGEVSDQAY